MKHAPSLIVVFIVLALCLTHSYLIGMAADVFVHPALMSHGSLGDRSLACGVPVIAAEVSGLL